MRKLNRVGVGVAVLTALGLCLCHLCVTGFQPWRFRPLGDLWWSQGYGRGFPVDTKAREKYLRKLSTGAPKERAVAARQLAFPGHEGFAPALDPVTATLAGDPSPHVRLWAALGLLDYALFASDPRSQLIALNHVGRAMVADPEPTNRSYLAWVLGAWMDHFSRHSAPGLYVEASKVVVRFAAEGARDKDASVAGECRALLKQLQGQTGRGKAGSACGVPAPAARLAQQGRRNKGP